VGPTIIDLDPFAPGRSIPNTVNSLFAGHDDGDYALADGGMGKVEVYDFFGGSGEFPPNPPIKEGVFGGLVTRLSGFRGPRWNLALDVLGGEGQTTAVERCGSI
jgi:hypothetical protein